MIVRIRSLASCLVSADGFMSSLLLMSEYSKSLMKSKLPIIAALASIACIVMPSHALTAQQKFDLCRSVMENRPYNPAIDGPYPKPTNSIGYGAYPPPEQRGVWIDNQCWDFPNIYEPF